MLIKLRYKTPSLGLFAQLVLLQGLVFDDFARIFEVHQQIIF
jgi:hypothetical protein